MSAFVCRMGSILTLQSGLPKPPSPEARRSGRATKTLGYCSAEFHDIFSRQHVPGVLGPNMMKFHFAVPQNLPCRFFRGPIGVMIRHEHFKGSQRSREWLTTVEAKPPAVRTGNLKLVQLPRQPLRFIAIGERCANRKRFSKDVRDTFVTSQFA